MDRDSGAQNAALGAIAGAAGSGGPEPHGGPGDDTLVARYRRELGHGVTWLRFPRDLELEFRQDWLPPARLRVIIAVVLLTTLSVALGMLNRALVPAVSPPPYAALRSLVGYPATALLLIGCLWPALYVRSWPPIGALASAVSGLSGAFSAAAQVAAGNNHVFSYLIAVIMVIYLGFAIPFWWALAAGLTVSIGYVRFATFFDVPGLVLDYELWILAVANLVAIASNGISERATRRAFLEGRIVALVNEKASQLNLIMNRTVKAVLVTDKAGQIEWANDGFLRMTGYRMDQVRGSKPQNLFTNLKTNTAEMRLVSAAVARGEPTSVEVFHVMADGFEQTLHLELDPLRDDAGRTTGFIGLGTDLTDQRRMEHSGRAAAAFLRASLDAISKHVAIVDHRGVIVMVNKAWREFARSNDGDLARVCEGANYLAACDAGALEVGSAAVAGQIRHALAGGEPYPPVTYPCHSPREERWFDSQVTGFESDGKHFAIVLHNPVTALHEARQEIDRRAMENQRLAFVVEHTDSAVLIADSRGRIQWVNPGFTRLLGYDLQDIAGQTPEAFLYGPAEDSSPEGSSTLAGKLLAGSGTDHEIQVRAKDGAPLWVKREIRSVRDAHGAITQFYAVMTDISDLRRVQDSLFTTEERLNLALEASGVGVWDFDVATGKVFYCHRWKAILGLSDREIGDTSWEWTSRIHPADIDRVMEDTRNHASGDTDSYATEFRMRHKDGTYRAVVMRGKVTSRSGDGQPLRWVGTLSDLTAQKVIESEVATSRKLESIGQLAAGIAHEINTPMQYIGDSVHFLRQAFDDLMGVVASLPVVDADGTGDVDVAYLRQRTPQAFDRAEDGIARVSAIVQAMREFSRPDQKEMSPADINKALESTLVVARNEYKYVADVETSFASLPLVDCRIAELNQVFLNLVVNASHAIAAVVGDSGERGLIRITTRSEPGYVAVDIADSGAGIPEEIQHRVFEIFFTTKPIGKARARAWQLPARSWSRSTAARSPSRAHPVAEPPSRSACPWHPEGQQHHEADPLRGRRTPRPRWTAGRPVPLSTQVGDDLCRLGTRSP